MIKLYGMGISRWMRPYWLLQELGVEFEPVVLDMRQGAHLSPEYLALNPHGKVPTLVDGDLVVTESSAMCLYLGEKYRDRGLLPEPGTPESAHHLRWIFFGVTEIEQPLWRMARNRFLYPPDKRQASDIEMARREASQALEILDHHLEGRDYLLGDRFSVADVIVGYAVVWASWERLTSHLLPVSRYLDRLLERPAFPEQLKSPPPSLGP